MKQNQATLQQVLEAHKGIIYKVARSYCPDEQDRDDLVQEIIIQLWRSIARYNPAYRLSTWVYRIALNTAISHYRKAKVRQEKQHILSQSPLPANSPQQDDEQEEQIGQLYAFIQQLRELDKALILLHLDGLSNPEVSEVLGISQSNVSTRLSRIRQELKKKFDTLNQEANARP